METNEILGNAAMYGGSLTACTSAPAAFMNESNMLLVLSAAGALSAVLGLVYTVWNGNRNFKLQQRQLEMRLRGESHGA